MKVFFKLLSLSLILCILAGCGPSEAPTQATDPTRATTVPTEPTVDPEAEFLRENLPVMDGSTSLIPLEAGIRAALCDLTIEQAESLVSHSSTWQAYYNLLDGTADLIFSCPLSAEQRENAAYRGIELETVPIAMEGFVFVVNAENPVDTLTQQQIRDIYSGKITNWSELGGPDEEILAYQRNRDSGSQNYMLEFMGDTPLMDAPVEMRPASMSGLMDVIAVNDNSPASIGYSVYAYAADMYGNGNEIKFIQVDGVAPSKATFASGEYPLLGKNYAVFRSDEPEDSPVRRLVRWLLTEQGQTAIAKAGYVPVSKLEYTWPEATMEPYQATGTGPQFVEISSTEYVLLDTCYYDWGEGYAIPKLQPEPLQSDDGTTYRITGLANEALQQEINTWIDEQMVWAATQESLRDAQIARLNLDPDYPAFVPGFLWSDAQPEGMETACTVTAKNGYLSVAITVGYTQHIFYSYDRSYRTQTATWDLISGKRLKPEDLFCQGVDIDAVLNEYIRSYSLSAVDHTGYVPELKQDFVALPASGWHITHDALYFDFDNPYFRQGEIIALKDLPDGVLSCDIPREFSHCLAPDGDLCCQEQYRVSDRDFRYCYSSDGYATYALLKEDSHPNAAAINTVVENYIETHFTEHAIRSFFEHQGYGYDCAIDTGMGLDWYLTKLGQDYLIFRGTGPMLYTDDEIIPYPVANHLIFDLTTGKQITWRDMLKEGWQDAVALLDSSVPISDYDPDTLEMDYMFYIQNDWDAPLFICFAAGTWIEMPIDWILPTTERSNAP